MQEIIESNKDVPAIAGNDPHYNQTYRQEEWDKWVKAQHSKKVEPLKEEQC